MNAGKYAANKPAAFILPLGELFDVYDLLNEKDKLSAADTAFSNLSNQSKSKSPSISVICGIAEKYQIIIDGFITAADYDAGDCRKLLGYISEEPEDLIFGELHGNWEVAKQNRDNEESAKNTYIRDNTYTKTSWEMISDVLTEVTTNVTPDWWIVDGYNQRIQSYQDEMDAWQAKLDRLGEFEDRSGVLFVNSAEFRANAINALSELNSCLSSDGSFKDNSDSSALDNLAKLHAQRQEEYYNQWLDENGNPDMDAINAFLSQDPDSVTLDQRLAFSDFDRNFSGKVNPSNGDVYDFSGFWNFSDKGGYENGKESQLDELESRKEAYLKVLEQISDPHERNYYLGLIAQLDESINNIDKPQTKPLDDKIFIKTTYTSQRLADLYEEKEALEKAIEMDPSQRTYLQDRIAMLESNINTLVDYGIDNAKHKEAFRFAYDQMKMSGYTEEEILKVVSYWMHVDGNDNLQGKEMPPWWEREYLTIPDDLKLNEDDVVECFNGSEKGNALFKYYEKTYLICDAISGRGNQVLGNVPMTSEEIRNEYLSGYRDKLYFSWLDYVYGGMYDYAKNIGSVRANKYALENYMDFPDQTSEYGVYKTYSNIENDYYRFCKDAYLYKYDHADEYYNNILNKDKWTKDVINYLKTSDNVDERLLFYLKGDVNRTDKSFTLEEQKLIKDNYRAYKNGEIMQSKNLYDMAAQLQEDQSVYACEYTVKVEGQKIIIDARIILPTGYFDTKYDRFELDFSDCCSSAFGSLYISNEVFAEKMFEYSKYRYENGWIDSLVTSLREDQVEEVINSDEFNRSIAQNIENYNELSEEEKNLIIDEYRKYLYITADCQDGIMSIYERDRTTKIEKANKEWDQALLALSLMALMAVPFNPTMAGVAGAALGYINGAKQCLQGNYYEGGTEIVLTTAAIAAPFVLEQVSNAKAVRALKNADEILDVSDNIDDAERLARNVEELKNVPDNEIDGFLELRKVESEKNSEFIGKSIHNKKETDLFLLDEFYDKNLPRQVSPGTKYLPKYDEFGNVKQIKMYDDYGREIGYVDFTNHGYGNIDSLDYHTVPHWHERVYDAINPDGMKIHHRTDVNTPLGDK